MKTYSRKILFLLLALISYPLCAQEIALQLYSLREQMKENPVKYHEMIAQWGIQNLEGGGTYGMSQETYDQLLKDNGLKIIGVGANYETLKNNPQEIIDRAKHYGAKYATCTWIPHTNGEFSFKETKEAVDLFNEAGKILKKSGITLAYHPHGYEFKPHEGGVLFDYFLKNAKHFDFNMDVYWVQMGGGDPVAIMKAYPKKFPMLHVKDRAHGTPGSTDGRGDVESNVPLGTGDLDMEGIILQAKKNRTKYLIIEDESSRSVEQIPHSVGFIKKILDR
ncbi:sugar phosphate isomerase/epimerase family protein [Pararhodonellum marinum]|uniref:sugar phosphate isomerase/epimerase family protein n=1 Tax=Pararhodonellum marinum TaxID=2755358 RepID=UPI00188FBF7E|nr:TIM barrel protein [Pararhodonellum marinum]